MVRPIVEATSNQDMSTIEAEAFAMLVVTEEEVPLRRQQTNGLTTSKHRTWTVFGAQDLRGLSLL